MSEQKSKRPVKTAGYSSHTLHAKRERKREQAEARNAAWQAFHPQAQLDSLAERRGSSVRQIRRICIKRSEEKGAK